MRENPHVYISISSPTSPHDLPYCLYPIDCFLSPFQMILGSAPVDHELNAWLRDSASPPLIKGFFGIIRGLWLDPVHLSVTALQ